MTSKKVARTQVSVRLIQTLRVFGAGLDVTTLVDLRERIATGPYEWLHDEFAAAIRGEAFSDESWLATVAAPRRASAGGTVPAQQRLVWDTLFPGEPFPGKPSEPEGAIAMSTVRPPGRTRRARVTRQR